MNSSEACHIVEGVPGLYVDAFKGSFLRKTTDVENTFILTHYHGDHYQSLPREGKYKGPALIHCTPVTAALLRNVHQVPPQFVVEHPYGQTWILPSTRLKSPVKITFYDANHCPGAAIVAIQLPDGTVHVHTGDMRYHPKMKSYPVIQRAVQDKKIDLLYLDTTYGHPKHTFVPQEVAIDTIATQIHQVLSSHGQCGDQTNRASGDDPNKPKVLVLLSCYSIGKERVLWEACSRVDQPIYVTDRKLNMMRCIQSTRGTHDGDTEQPGSDDSAAEENDVHACNQMIQRCTSDPNATDLHCIRMGMAGELWPFFQPNYRNCVDYAEELQTNYDKILAFIPTGWSDATNWNKKNAVSKRQLECRKSKRRIDVEIRLVAYSEHSSCSELESFVDYCRPRKVIPTVFKDDNDRRRLEKLFRKYIDSSRAKLRFFKGMQAKSHTSSLAKTSSSESANKQEAAVPESFSQPATATCTTDSIKREMNQTVQSETPGDDQALRHEGSAAKAQTHGHDDGTSAATSTDKFVDLTGASSDDDEPETTLSDADPAKKRETTTKPRIDRPVKHQQQKKVTPTKRKRGKGGDDKSSTPPITQFFTVKK